MELEKEDIDVSKKMKNSKKTDKVGIFERLRAYINRSLKNKTVATGLYVSIVSVIFIAVVIFINLIVTKADITGDLTSNKMYSITDETIEIQLAPNGGSSSGSISVEWAALYEGAYDASTLPAYQPKGYSAELAECRRYYKVIDVNVAPWLFEGTTIRRYYVGYEPMRTAPTVDVSGLKEYGTWTDLGSALNPYNIKNNRVLLNATSETTSTRLYIGGSIALSADL